MKKILLILLIFLSLKSLGQSKLYFRCDSCFFQGTSNASLVIKGINRDSLGFVLTNMGGGVMQLKPLDTLNRFVTAVVKNATGDSFYVFKGNVYTALKDSIGLTSASTLQQVLSAGNRLTRNDSIKAAGFIFTVDSAASFKINSPLGAYFLVGVLAGNHYAQIGDLDGVNRGTKLTLNDFDSSANIYADNLYLQRVATGTAPNALLLTIDSSTKKVYRQLVPSVFPTLQFVTTNGNTTTKSIYVDSLISNNHTYLKKTLLVGNSSYVSSKGTQIVAYGNSITAGAGATTPLYDYVSIFSNSYNIGQGGITNHGIGGAILDTFFTLSIPAYTSAIRYYTMMWGTNEQGQGWDTARYHTTYKRAIDSLKSKSGAPSSKIIIFQVIPRAYTDLSAFAYIDSILSIQEGVRFVPLYYSLLSYGFLNFIVDGVHPSDAGHNLIANQSELSLNDSDVVGLSNTLNSTKTGFLQTNVLTAKSGAFINDIHVNGLEVGNYGNTTNAFLGYNVAPANQGNYNVAVGSLAFSANYTGSYNTAIGQTALYSNFTASYNTGIGAGALYLNDGIQNTGIGQNALGRNTSGGQNTAIGQAALYSNTTGSSNTASGQNALFSNTTGSGNTAAGQSSLYSNTTGIQNTANGQNALASNTTGSSNTATGQNSLVSNTTGSTGTATGQNALLSNTTGSNNTATGQGALQANTTGTYNTAMGQGSLQANTTADYNNAFGGMALNVNTTGTKNIAVGYGTLLSNTTGSKNTANGHFSLISNTTADANTANGEESLLSNTTGANNTAMGYQSLFLSATTSNNTGIGYRALFNSTGSNNTAVGYNTMLPVALSNAANIAGIFILNRNDHDSVAGTTNEVGINTISPTSVLNVNGSVAYAYVAKTANYTATINDYTLDCTSGTFTISLPASAGIGGRIYVIKNSGTGVITIDGNASETIDGATTKILNTQYSTMAIQSDNVNWKIISTF